jgi:hypothetical protein
MRTLFVIVGFLITTSTVAQFSDTPPPGAPTEVCDVMPNPDPHSLRIFNGSTTIPFVLACGVRTSGKCSTQQMQPGSKDLPPTAVAAVGREKDGWSCIFFSGVSGWVPSDRLAPLPAEPAVPLAAWTGWYREYKGTSGIRNNRLLLAAGKTPGTIHVSGRAYWYGLNDSVHTGQIDADATPYGKYLHVVEGDTERACVLDLVIDPSTHTLAADDNAACGGMNVRFWGKWSRFTPSTSHSK